jgi:HEPN domain-containing protein
VKRKDFQELANLRLKEARSLLHARCWEGAYYLAGYVAECALKACIARQTERHDFPDKDRVNASHTHDLRKLVELAGLRDGLREAERAYPEFRANWIIVRDWLEGSRYERPPQTEAENLVKALAERRHGVLQWLRQHW